MKKITNKELLSKAQKSAVNTLRRIESASGNEAIRKILNGLYADLHHLRNAENLETPEAHTLSDGYDLVHVAYAYMAERLQAGLTPDDMETKTLKNGKEKTKTVYQWACSAVRRAIYENKSIESNGKYLYIEDLRTNADADDVHPLDRHYIRIGKYYDVGGTVRSDGIHSSMDGIYTGDYDDYARMMGMLDALRLTDRQNLIVHYRLQGFSVKSIAAKMATSEKAISEMLRRIRSKAENLLPDATITIK